MLGRIKLDPTDYDRVVSGGKKGYVLLGQCLNKAILLKLHYFKANIPTLKSSEDCHGKPESSWNLQSCLRIVRLNVPVG